MNSSYKSDNLLNKDLQLHYSFKNEDPIRSLLNSNWQYQESYPLSKDNIQTQELQILGQGDFYEMGLDTYQMITQRKGKKNKSNLEQELSEDIEKIGIIFQNKQSIVDFKFNTLLNELAIIKQNLNSKEEFERECEALKILNDKGVTLEIISINQDNQSFEQVAGKTTLKLLKQKIQPKNIFETFYFILFDKLNKMHEYGIAHSDIKPQNIIISYYDEPFFIDFGGSISLSNENDYKNYLTNFTPDFNLKIHFEKFNAKQRIYQPKKFKSKEEIILCEKAQLCLTFLSLLCDDENQLNLFLSKQYNELLQILLENNNNNITLDIYSKINRKAILYNISRTLNQADPEINIIEDGNEQIFFIDEYNIQIKLRDSNDVVFNNGIYKVKRIDQISILLIYYLDKQGYNLEITPQDTFITILSDMKEYQYIYQKYKIDVYFQNLQNSLISLSVQNQYNILQYTQRNKIGNFNFKKCYDESFTLFLIKLQKQYQKHPLGLNMEFNHSFLHEFVMRLKSNLNNYCVQNIVIVSNRSANFRLINNPNQNQQIASVNVKMDLSSYHDHGDTFKRAYETIKNCCKIKQLDVYFKCLIYNNQIGKKELDYLQFIKKVTKQVNQEYKYDLKIQFEQKSVLENIFIKRFKMDNEDLKEQIDIQSCQQVENFICESLQTIQDNQKVFFKIFGYTFRLQQLWLQIKDIIENKSNIYIEMKIINCQYSKQVAQVLKQLMDTYQTADKVIYRFQERYFENENEFDNLKYQLNVEYIEQQQQSYEQGLNIIFYKECNLKGIQTSNYQNDKLQTINHSQDNNKLETQNEKKEVDNINDINDVFDKEDFSHHTDAQDDKDISDNDISGNKDDSNNNASDNDVCENDEVSDKDENSNNDNDSDQDEDDSDQDDDDSDGDEIQNFFEQDSDFQFPEFTELKIQYKQQYYHQKFKFMSKREHLYVEEIKNTDLIIKDLNNKNTYQDIWILNKVNKNQFKYDFDNNQNLFHICWDSEDIHNLNIFKQLLLAITKNFYSFQLNKKGYYPLYNRSLIHQIMIYSHYTIYQQVRYSYFNENKYNCVFEFLETNTFYNANNQEYKDFIEFIFISYSIKLNDLNLYQSDKIDQVRDLLINQTLQHSFDHFQRHSIINQMLPKQMFQKKQVLYYIDFYNSERIDDNFFQLFFEEIEKTYTQNKFYSLRYSKLLQQTLYNIYEALKIYKLQNKLYIDLAYNNISYNDFKQFIQSKLQHQNNYINKFIFKIKNNTPEVEYCLKNDFKDTLQVDLIDDFLILQFKHELSIYNQTKTIQLEFVFTSFNINSSDETIKQPFLNLNQDSHQNEQLKIESTVSNENDKNVEFKNKQNIYFENIKEQQEQKNSQDKQTESINKDNELLDYQILKQFIQSYN